MQFRNVVENRSKLPGEAFLLGFVQFKPGQKSDFLYLFAVDHAGYLSIFLSIAEGAPLTFDGELIVDLHDTLDGLRVFEGTAALGIIFHLTAQGDHA